MAEAPLLKVKDASIFERRFTMRMPFRFEAATVTEAAQIFLSLDVEDAQGRIATGYSAELMVPKWFDKNPALSNADNEQQLRRSVHLAVALSKEAPASTAFGLHAGLEPQHHAQAASEGLNGLIASFGLALVDRAILDALCRLHALPLVDVIRSNLPAMDLSTTPDLDGFDVAGFLKQVIPHKTLYLRHTVGYIDPLTPQEINGPRRDDGLPECLREEIETYGIQYFKLKVSGRPQEDTERLKDIAAVLDRLPGYKATLDGNEQFADEAAVIDLMDRIEKEPALARLRQSLLFVEQPIIRTMALSQPVKTLAKRVALEIDESDGTKDAFLEAREQGYLGVSSKSCKGFYRSFLNKMRVEKWNAETGGGYFMSAEDLTTQAGIAVQQDLALASLLNLGHIERNGHHYVDGMQGASASEDAAWLSAHGDLYRDHQGRARLTMQNGQLSLDTILAAKGLGAAQAAAQATFQTLQEKENAA
ncbi:mandelate racemase [Agrobacterium rosae]|uniref:mandelate racemase n=1 Tax=Agrobacterium rosae TaxID=1972867 RepID=UPI00122F8ED2|nr:mandelate racemase [Agrobacterium rosae]KAA3511673.1 mandelate racemase [Agrobacterium rosae]KAA3518905.1 mandelate racemase [Agrobacterium rosae]MQB49374.1 mandelate racemase [Agrobacterium rosae]